MANQYVNKVIIGNEVKIDLTGDDITAEKLAALGVKGILNFTNVELDLAHTNTAVQNVHIGDSLMQLTYKMRAGASKDEDEE